MRRAARRTSVRRGRASVLWKRAEIARAPHAGEIVDRRAHHRAAGRAPRQTPSDVDRERIGARLRRSAASSTRARPGLRSARPARPRKSDAEGVEVAADAVRQRGVDAARRVIWRTSVESLRRRPPRTAESRRAAASPSKASSSSASAMRQARGSRVAAGERDRPQRREALEAAAMREQDLAAPGRAVGARSRCRRRPRR